MESGVGCGRVGSERARGWVSVRLREREAVCGSRTDGNGRRRVVVRV